MKTALEMADFILRREAGPGIRFASIDKTREKRRRYLADLFQPIEQALWVNAGLSPEEGDDVLYAITSHGMAMVCQASSDLIDDTWWGPTNSSGTRAIPIPDFRDANVAVAFTANRCIITHTYKTAKKTIRTIPYDIITKVEPTAGEYVQFGSRHGQMNLVTATSDEVIFLTEPMPPKSQILYRQFTPEQACAAVNELVMKYKQAGYAGQYQAAAPQAAPQPAPQAPRAAAPAAGGLSPETVEALKQLKDLLDAGILTQEEFDGKKKQLLGL